MANFNLPPGWPSGRPWIRIRHDVLAAMERLGHDDSGSKEFLTSLDEIPNDAGYDYAAWSAYRDAISGHGKKLAFKALRIMINARGLTHYPFEGEVQKTLESRPP